MVNKSKIDPKEIKNIISMYASGESQLSIAKQYHVCQQTVCKILKNNNINCSNRIYRKNRINELFFDTWSNDMAYILGFTATDGSVNKYTLSYNISLKDIEILEFIRSCIGFVDIEYKEKYNSCRIRFNSVKLIKSLNKLGITQNKTYSLQITKNIPQQYIGDYIRGVFDGDGWISKRSGKRNGLSFGICSASKAFIEGIYELCGKLGTIRCRSYENDPIRKPQYYLENYNNADAIKFRELIYSSKNFSLKRKFDIFFSRLKKN